MKRFQNLPVIENLVTELGRLPGIGPKSAVAIAYHLVNQPAEKIRRLTEALTLLSEKVFHCLVCGNLTEQNPCWICQDETRDRNLLCVVEAPLDLLSIERSGAYNGLYHVLGGVLSPLDGVGPSELRIRELLERLKSGEIREIILATNPSVEGEATAAWIRQTIEGLNLGITLSRFARGLPMGGDLVYADEETLVMAIRGRRRLEE